MVRTAPAEISRRQFLAAGGLTTRSVPGSETSTALYVPFICLSLYPALDDDYNPFSGFDSRNRHPVTAFFAG